MLQQTSDLTKNFGAGTHARAYTKKTKPHMANRRIKTGGGATLQNMKQALTGRRTMYILRL